MSQPLFREKTLCICPTKSEVLCVVIPSVSDCPLLRYRRPIAGHHTLAGVGAAQLPAPPPAPLPCRSLAPLPRRSPAPSSRSTSRIYPLLRGKCRLFLPWFGRVSYSGGWAATDWGGAVDPPPRIRFGAAALGLEGMGTRESMSWCCGAGCDEASNFVLHVRRRRGSWWWWGGSATGRPSSSSFSSPAGFEGGQCVARFLHRYLFLHICAICGMMYARGNDEDEKVHRPLQGISVRWIHSFMSRCLTFWRNVDCLYIWKRFICWWSLLLKMSECMSKIRYKTNAANMHTIANI
jgi:hypothetical protein